MKLTKPLERVLRVFLADTSARRYGYDLMKAARLPSGTLYPMLARLQDQGQHGVEGAAGEPGRLHQVIAVAAGGGVGEKDPQDALEGTG